MIGTYYVGQIPKDPLQIDVKDDNGYAVNLQDYDFVEARMLDSNDRLLDLSTATVGITDQAAGRIVFNWPPVSLFTEPGEYVMQLVLHGLNGSKDMTNTQLLLVRGFGNVHNNR